MREQKAAVTASKVCKACPLNSICKKCTNPSALGLCEEAAIWLVFGLAVAVEIKILF